MTTGEVCHRHLRGGAGMVGLAAAGFSKVKYGCKMASASAPSTGRLRSVRLHHFMRHERRPADQFASARRRDRSTRTNPSLNSSSRGTGRSRYRLHWRANGGSNWRQEPRGSAIGPDGGARTAALAALSGKRGQLKPRRVRNSSDRGIFSFTNRTETWFDYTNSITG